MSRSTEKLEIAVTGSCGKTTTREFIASVLETKWKILKTEGNRNLPNHTKEIVSQFDSSYRAIVLELGMGKPGAGTRHCLHIKPDISVITNIGTAHYGNLGNSIKSTAKNKSELIHNMNPKGILLLNNDDDNSKLLDTRSFAGRIVTIGMKQKADYRALNVRYGRKGMRFDVIIDDKSESFFIPTFGYHNVQNALFAVAIGHMNQFSPSRIRSGLKTYQVPAKRLSVHPYMNHSLIIDDTINANPQSMKAGIDVLRALSERNKKIAILGSMLELGRHSENGHIEVGRYLARKHFDSIYALGREAKWIREGALRAGFPKRKVKHFEDREQLHEALRTDLKPKSAILVKGSRLTEMDKTVEFLLGLTGK